MKDPREVFNAFKQQCNGKLKKVEAFVASHVSTSLTSDDVDRLRDLNTALKEQWWGRMEVAHKGLNSPERFTNLPLVLMSSILN